MPSPDADDIHFFGSSASIEQAEAVLADPRSDAASTADAALKLAWWLRQRDTQAALRHANALQAGPAQPHVQARLALVRGEAALLFDRLDEVDGHIAAARSGFAKHPQGLGDTALLDAALRDQQGHDRALPLRQALRHFQGAGDAARQRLASTWLACLEAMQDPERASRLGICPGRCRRPARARTVDLR